MSILSKKYVIERYIKYCGYRDKSELIKDFLFECVVDFVENDLAKTVPSEEGESNYEQVSDEDFLIFLPNCFNYIKLGRSKLDKTIKESLLNAALEDDDEERTLYKVECLEKAKRLKDLDNKFLCGIVRHRERFLK